MRLWLPLMFSITLAICGTFFSIYLFKKVWKNKSKNRTITINITLSFFSIAYSFLIIEIFFGLFFIKSDGFGFTLAARRWSQKYWHPINTESYRDYNHNWKSKILFVLGDSFAAGYGIKNIEDRFSNILANKLQDTWSVGVVAKCGWNTKDEIEALKSHQKKPDRVIVSYFINDIEHAAEINEIILPNVISMPHDLIKPFVSNFFSLNWLYWRKFPENSENLYWEYLMKAYNNQEVWKSHTQELNALINHCKNINADVTFLVWPHLIALEESGSITSKVVDYLREQGVQVIDLYNYLAGRNPKDLIVNSRDDHANVDLNKEVADIIYNTLSPWK